MRTRIIGLGNPILTDDGVGILAARELQRKLGAGHLADPIEIVESEVAGFALMELMAGWDRVIFLDSIQFDAVKSGTVIRMEPGDLRTSLRLKSAHEIDLPTALEIGRRLGMEMPREVIIFGIQAENTRSFGRTLTPAVERGMREAVDLVLNELAREQKTQSA